MREFVAVDAGGTSTRAVVVDEQGRCRGAGRATGGNPTSRGTAAAAAAVAAAIRQALEVADADPPSVQAVLLAHAGASGTDYRDGITRLLEPLGLHAPITAVGDLLALFSSGTPQAEGAALIAGTGAIGGAVRDGRLARVVDGTGWLLGDAGSGFWIGHRIARAVVDDLDGGPATALTPVLLSRLGLRDDRTAVDGRPRVLLDLVGRLYALRPVELADLAPLAFRLPEDEVARGILREAVAALAALLARVRAVQSEGPLVFGGSVLVQGVLRLAAPLQAPLLAAAGGTTPIPVGDGLVGAAVLALRRGGVAVDAAVFSTLTTSVRDATAVRAALPAPDTAVPLERAVADEASPTIRAPRFSDTAAVYRVCFETGAAFQRPPGERPTPELLGHVYAGPYLAFAPEWCRVVVDARGVAGYLLAVPSTAAFERWAEAEWWPPLRAEHPSGAATLPAHDQEVAAELAAPPSSPAAIAAAYPAHLHIDLLERLRGRGLARTLIDDLCDRLAAAGVPGVHLGVWPGNSNAIGFYRHLGFTELDRGDHVVWMGRGIAAATAG